MSTCGSGRLGLPIWAIVVLAALGVPRVVAHDLRLVGDATNFALVFAPLLVWFVVVLWRRVPNPLLTLLAVGICYGVLLALTHQLLWTSSFAGDPPRLGGNLADTPPAVQDVLVRTFAVLSSLVTGTITGAAVGAVAWAVHKLRNRRSNTTVS